MPVGKHCHCIRGPNANWTLGIAGPTSQRLLGPAALIVRFHTCASTPLINSKLMRVQNVPSAGETRLIQIIHVVNGPRKM